MELNLNGVAYQFAELVADILYSKYKKENNHEFLTRTEASEYLKVSPQTIDNYLKHGKLTKKKIGKTVLISKLEITSLFNSTNTNQTKEGWKRR